MDSVIVAVGMLASALVGFLAARFWRPTPVASKDPRTMAVVETNRMLLSALIALQAKEPRAALVTAERLARPGSTLFDHPGFPDSSPPPTPAEQAQKVRGGAYGVSLA